MSRFKIVLIVMTVLFFAFTGYVLKVLHDAGSFKTIIPLVPPHCRLVGGLLGSEDITIDKETGVAYISSAEFRIPEDATVIPRGDIYAYNLEEKSPSLKVLTDNFNEDFNPHGIGLYNGPEGKSLFVVNHRRNGDYVEIFDIKNGELVHRRSVSDPLMHSPNDVAPVGMDRFYVTNDHGNTSNIARKLEELLSLKSSSLLYFDGNTMKVAAGDFAYANGVNLSPDGTYVYVAETLGRAIKVFERNRIDGSLKLLENIFLDTGVDNIEVDESGNMWIGAHPRMLDFLAYASDQSHKSPSQVIKLSVVPGHGYVVTDIFISDGSDISGSSVAAFYKNTMLVGSVFDDAFLLCKKEIAESGDQSKKAD